MMRSAKKNILLISIAFLLCGFLHVLLYGVGLTDNIAQLFCGCFTLLWWISVRKRVIDGRLRRILEAVAILLLFYLLLQICRYTLFAGNETAQRYLWYFFYIPMILIPLLCLHLAIFVHQPAEKKSDPVLWLAAVIAVFLIAGILTNDLHGWMKIFPDVTPYGDAGVKNGWLYYVASAYIYVVYTVSFVILLVKSRKFQGQPYRWLTVIPMLIGIVYFMLFPLEIGIRLFGCRIWNMGEMLVFCLIGSLEGCILMGFIPANTGYEELFSLADLSAAILDDSGDVKYTAAGGTYPFPESEDLLIMSHPIDGGRVEWAVDIGQFHALNRALEETTLQMEARNNYLAAEAKVKAERAELETRNRIYDRIIGIIQPQKDLISTMIEDQRRPFEEKLPVIAVLSDYMKRRSNMELIEEEGRLPFEELVIAASETSDYVGLCGVNTAVTSYGSGHFSSDLVIAAYEQIEAVIEENVETMTDLLISLKAAGQELTVRMMLRLTGQQDSQKSAGEGGRENGASFRRASTAEGGRENGASFRRASTAEDDRENGSSFRRESAGGAGRDNGRFFRHVSVTEDGPDRILVYTFSEGGRTDDE